MKMDSVDTYQCYLHSLPQPLRRAENINFMIYFLLGINVGLGIAVLLGGAKGVYDFLNKFNE